MPLETIDIVGVECLAVGQWSGDDYTLQDLTDMAEVWNGGNAGIEPPLKLGHNEEQPLLIKDGMPAAGYVSALRVAGDKLVADFRDVPKRIGDLIKARSYKKVSAEVWFNLRHEGKRLPRVLKAIALLGADVPAVTSLADIEALYGADLATVQAHYAADADAFEFEFEHTEAPPVVHTTEYVQNDPAVGGGVDRDKLPDSDFAGKGRSFPIVTPGDVQDAAASIGRAGAGNYPPDELRRRIIAIAKRKGASFVGRLPAAWRDAMDGGSSSRKDMSVNVEILKLLGLTDDADDAAVLARVTALTSATAPAALATSTERERTTDSKSDTESRYSAEEFRTLQNQVGTLTATLTQRDAAAAVEEALRDGKVVPAQRAWATGYAIKDLEGFRAYAAAAPAFPLGTKGSAGDGTEEAAQITEAEKLVAKQLGLDEKTLLASKERQLAR